jgi:hypothetical protein
VNNIESNDLDYNVILHTLRNSNSTVNLLIRRRRCQTSNWSFRFGDFNCFLFLRPNKLYKTSKNLQLTDCQGLTLELGVYVAEIQQGSKAAKDKGISVGDRVLNVRLLI